MADRVRSLLVRFTGDSKGLDGEAKGVVGKLGSIKSAVGEADGFFGKLKAGGSASLQAVGGAGAIATAGVAAAAAAAAKGVMDFERLGLQIGKMHDSTGIAYEDLSRIVEVAGDLGIEAGTLEGSLGKFNKTIGQSPQVLKQLNVDLVTTKDGATDVQATFLNAVDAINKIEDPTKRAAAAQQLFGKSWQSMSELIATGSDTLRSKMAQVSEHKIFDQQKVEEARKLRDVFDQIQDAGQDLFLTLGEALAPVVAELAPKFAKILEQVSPLVSGIGDLMASVMGLLGPIQDLAGKLVGPLFEALGKVAGMASEVIDKVGSLATSVFGGEEKVLSFNDTLAEHVTAQIEAKDAIDDTSDRAQYYESRVAAAKDETVAFTQAMGDLHQELLDEQSWYSIEGAIESYKKKIGEAGASNRDKAAALVDLKIKLLEYVSGLEGIPAEKQAQIVTLIDQGKIDEAEAKLAQLARPRNAPINPTTGGSMVVVPKFDGGGVMPGPLGEHNLALVAGGETVVPTHKPGVRATAAMSGAGVMVVVQGNVYGVDDMKGIIKEAISEMGRDSRGNQ